MLCSWLTTVLRWSRVRSVVRSVLCASLGLTDLMRFGVLFNTQSDFRAVPTSHRWVQLPPLRRTHGGHHRLFKGGERSGHGRTSPQTHKHAPCDAARFGFVRCIAEDLKVPARRMHMQQFFNDDVLSRCTAELTSTCLRLPSHVIVADMVYGAIVRCGLTHPLSPHCAPHEFCNSQ